jgi:hypothetical protein
MVVLIRSSLYSTRLWPVHKLDTEPAYMLGIGTSSFLISVVILYARQFLLIELVISDSFYL